MTATLLARFLFRGTLGTYPQICCLVDQPDRHHPCRLSTSNKRCNHFGVFVAHLAGYKKGFAPAIPNTVNLRIGTLTV